MSSRPAGFKPWLHVPVQWAHDRAPFFINCYSQFGRQKNFIWRPFTWRGIQFQNRLGLAGGVDKDAKSIGAWAKLGAGFVEVGTVTPLPQKPNPGTTVARDIGHLALWNKLGFPSQGATRVRERLERCTAKVPIFVNIGKNRATPNERAVQDYISLAHYFSETADALVVNVSSPNTKDLRDLQQRGHLENLLRQVKGAVRGSTPVLLKVSPDLLDRELDDVFDVGLSTAIDGWILTNSTKERPPGITFPAEGGLSGAPLAPKSKDILKRAVKRLGNSRGDRLLISVGGILSGADVLERLEMGADLVQVYSALIFSGPNFFADVAKVFGEREQVR